MSAVNVLAVMNDCRNDLDAARMGVAAKELAKARAAVAELIEADNEFDAARLSGNAARIGEAATRRRAALARVNGVQS